MSYDTKMLRIEFTVDVKTNIESINFSVDNFIKNIHERKLRFAGHFSGTRMKPYSDSLRVEHQAMTDHV